MKIFVIYDKNGDIASVLSPAEEFTNSISINAPEGYSFMELKSEDIAQVDHERDHPYDTIEVRKRRIMHYIHEQHAVDIKRQSLIRRSAKT